MLGKPRTQSRGQLQSSCLRLTEQNVSMGDTRIHSEDPFPMSRVPIFASDGDALFNGYDEPHVSASRAKDYVCLLTVSLIPLVQKRSPMSTTIDSVMDLLYHHM
jgi:hypothetical protein